MTQHFKNLRTFAIAITLMTGGVVLAQPGGQQGPPPIPSDKQIEKMVKELDKELSLSDTQAEEVSGLYFAHYEEIESIQKSSQRPSREKMEKLDSQFETDVKKVLDKDQQKLYTAWLKKQKKQRPQGGQGGQRPSR